MNFDYQQYISNYLLNALKISLSNCAIHQCKRQLDVIPMPHCILFALILQFNFQYFRNSNENSNDNSENMKDQLRIQIYPSGNVKSENFPTNFLWKWLNKGVPIQTDINDVVTSVSEASIVWKRHKHRFSLTLILDKVDKNSKIQK